MKVLVVAAPHAFATRDVYTGHVAGLRAMLGAENVVTYDIIPRYNMFHSWTQWLEEKVGHVPREVRANVLAAEPVFGAAHYHEVDAVYFVSPMYFPLSFVDMLRKDGFKTWAYFSECPYEDEIWARSQAPHFDHCFVNDRNSLARFRMFNENTHYLGHAFNPAVHYPTSLAPRDDRNRVVYVGTPFKKRVEYLEATDWSNIDLRLYGFWDEEGSVANSPLIPYIRPRLVRNEFTAMLYRAAAIGLSMHRTERYWVNGDLKQPFIGAEQHIDPGEAYSLGPRAFELAACGAFQISDDRPEVRDVFGDTVPVQRSPQEMGDLVRKYLDDPVRRREMAEKQRAAVQPYSVQARMAELLTTAA